MKALWLAILLSGCGGSPEPVKPAPAPLKQAPQPVKPQSDLIDVETTAPDRVYLFEGNSDYYRQTLPDYDRMVIFEHRGGRVWVQQVANQLHIRDAKTAHVPGYCISACTMLFEAGPLFTWSCGSQFGFHAASVPGPEPGQRIIHKGATLDVEDTYPIELFAELNATGAMAKLEITYLTGQQISDATGIPCGGGP